MRHDPNTSIAQDKQSAIYRINSNARPAVNTIADMDDMMDDEAGAAIVEEFDVTVGISIEPAAQAQSMIEQQRMARTSHQNAGVPTSKPAPQRPEDITTLANKIVEHAYNFLGSFTTPDGKVPMKAFNDWWAKFKSRLASDPKFLDNL
jgi:hypothetical protein